MPYPIPSLEHVRRPGRGVPLRHASLWGSFICFLLALLSGCGEEQGTSSGEDREGGSAEANATSAPGSRSADPGSLDPAEARAAVCAAFRLERDAFAPGERVRIVLDLPERMGEVDLAVWLRVEGERTGTAWMEATPEQTLLWVVPAHPLTPMEGGALILEAEADEEACAPITVEIAPLVPAPGALAAIAERMEPFLRAQAESLGLSWEALEARAEAGPIDGVEEAFPVFALPLLQALAWLRSDDNVFESLSERVSAEEEPWLVQLEAQLALAWPAEALDAEIARLADSPLRDLVYEEASIPRELRSKSRFLGLIPVIATPETLSEAMIEGYVNCAINQEGLSSGITSALADVAAVGKLIVELEKQINRADNLLRMMEAAQNASDMQSFLNQLEFAKGSRFVAALGNALKVIRAMQLVMWAIEELIRARCHLLPGEIVGLDPGPPLRIPEDSDREHDALPMTADVRSQQFDLYEMRAEFLPSIPPRIQPAVNAALTLNQHLAMLARAGAFMNDTPVDRTLSGLAEAADSLQRRIDEFDAFRMLGPLEWRVRFTEEEWIEWELLRELVLASRCPGGSLCVRVDEEPGVDELRMSLPVARFPEWAQQVRAAANERPSFASTTREIDVGRITISAPPSRRLVEPGERIEVPFSIRNAEDPSIRWDLSAGSFENGERHVIQETFEESPDGVWRDTLFIELPEDESRFPITLQGRSLSTSGTMRNGHYRGTSVTFALESAWIAPSGACLEPGEQIALEVVGLYADATVEWSADTGVITPSDDGTTALFRAPDVEQAEDLVVSARIQGTSGTGRSRDTIAEATFSMSCSCWWYATFTGPGGGVASGTDAVLTRSALYDPDAWMVSAANDGDVGIFLVFDPPPDGNLANRSLEAIADIWGGSFMGGAFTEREFGFVTTNQLRFTRASGGFIEGTFSGGYFTTAELLQAPREERAPQLTRIQMRFRATASDSVFCN